MPVLPSLIPIRRSELLRRISATQLQRDYAPVTRNVVAHRSLLRPEADIEFGAAEHPAGLRFCFDAVTRARAHHLQSSTAIIGGWAAAAYAGLPYWVDNAQTLVIVRSGRRISTNSMQPSRLIREPCRVVAPDPLFPALRAVSVEHATIDCLRELAVGLYSWRVPRIVGMSDRMVRSIQLVDALRRYSVLDVEFLRHAARGIYGQRRLTAVMKLSVDDTDSPPETVLRLLAGQVAPGVETQIPIYCGNGRLLTVADAGWRDKKVALFYDGVHHLRREQRDYDAEVAAVLYELGWKALRVTHGMFRDPRKLQARIAQLLG